MKLLINKEANEALAYFATHPIKDNEVDTLIDRTKVLAILALCEKLPDVDYDDQETFALYANGEVQGTYFFGIQEDIWIPLVQQLKPVNINHLRAIRTILINKGKVVDEYAGESKASWIVYQQTLCSFHTVWLKKYYPSAYTNALIELYKKNAIY